MKKRLLACLMTAAMLVSLFPLPALAAEAQRPEWMVTAFDPLDGDTAAQTVPQGGEPVLPEQLTAWAYVIEADTAVILIPEGSEQEDEQSQADGAKEPPASGEALTGTMAENDPEPADKQEPDIQPVTIPGVTWKAQPEFDPDTPGEYVYAPVLPAAYGVAEDVELPTITVTVEAAQEPEQTAVERVQALINALPDPENITPENRAGAEAQLEAIDEARAELTDEKTEQLNTARYQAAAAALAALDGQAGNDLPMPAADGDVSYRYCDANGQNWDTGTKHSGKYTLVTNDIATTWGTDDGQEHWYVASGDVTISQRIFIGGDVHLILEDGCSLTVDGGIHVNQYSAFKLTIYGQTGHRPVYAHGFCC